MNELALASFGSETLAILQAVKNGTPIQDETKERLHSFGLATISPEGFVTLSLCGETLLSYLENLALIPDEHVGFLSGTSGVPYQSKRVKP